jgi:hypothetical protein
MLEVQAVTSTWGFRAFCFSRGVNGLCEDDHGGQALAALETLQEVGRP